MPAVLATAWLLVCYSSSRVVYISFNQRVVYCVKSFYTSCWSVSVASIQLCVLTLNSTVNPSCAPGNPATSVGIIQRSRTQHPAGDHTILHTYTILKYPDE